MAYWFRRSFRILKESSFLAISLIFLISLLLLNQAINHSHDLEVKSIIKSVSFVVKRETGFDNSYDLSRKLIDLEVFGIIKCSSLKNDSTNEILFDLSQNEECLKFRNKPFYIQKLNNKYGASWILRFQPGVNSKYTRIKLISYLSLIIIFVITLFISMIIKYKGLLVRESRDLLVSQITHDIKSPLVSLTEIMTSQNLSTENRNHIQSTISRIEEMIRNLDHNPNIEKKNITPALTSLHDILREKELEYKGKIKTSIDIENPFCFLKINDFEFKRVLSNLINNSIEATSKATPSVNLKLYESNGFAQIEITDNGSGFPQDIKNRIGVFRFSTKSPSRGFGLSGAIRVIRNNGGNLKILNSSSSGTTIQISLPVLPIPYGVSTTVVSTSEIIKFVDFEELTDNKITNNIVVTTPVLSEEAMNFSINRSIPYTLKAFQPYLEVITPSRIIQIEDDKYIRSSWKNKALVKNLKIISFDNITDSLNLSPEKSDVCYLDLNLNGINVVKQASLLSEHGFKNIFLSTGSNLGSIPNLDFIKGVVGKGFPVI